MRNRCSKAKHIDVHVNALPTYRPITSSAGGGTGQEEGGGGGVCRMYVGCVRVCVGCVELGGEGRGPL